MSTHRLKIQTRWLDRVLTGEKRAEVRVHDRDYQAGDTIEFTEVDDEGRTIYSPGTSRTATARITHVLDGRHATGLLDSHCLLSIDDARETTPEPDADGAP